MGTLMYYIEVYGIVFSLIGYSFFIKHYKLGDYSTSLKIFDQNGKNYVHEKKLSKTYLNESINIPNIVSRIAIKNNFRVPSFTEAKKVGDIGSDSIIPSYSTVKNASESEKIEIVELKDVFVTKETIFIQDGVYYPFDCRCHWRVCSNSHKGLPTSYDYVIHDRVISISHEYSYFYAHWIMDMMPSFAILPAEIIENATIIIPFAQRFVIEGLGLLNIPISSIISLRENEVVFAKQFFTVLPIQCTVFSGYLLSNLREVISKKLNLDSKPPSMYVVYNRKTSFRGIENFNSVFNSIQSTYSNISWVMCDIPKGLADQFRFFNNILFFLSVHGGTYANTLFMQPKTVVVEIQVDRWVDNFLWISAFTNKYHVIGRNTSIKWRTESKNYLQSSYVNELVKTGLELIGKEI